MTNTLNRRTFVCSRLRGDYARNVERAFQYCEHALDQGGSPYAPHLYLPHVLDDSIPAERELGINTGIDFLETCGRVNVYTVDGLISEGMRKEITTAIKLEIPVYFYAVTINSRGLAVAKSGQPELLTITALTHLPTDTLPSQMQLMSPVQLREATREALDRIARNLAEGQAYDPEALDYVLGTGLAPRDADLEASWTEHTHNQD